MTDLLVVAPDLAGNSLGRAYCLWLLAKACGYGVRVVSAHGTAVWAPLAGTPFAADCAPLPAGGLSDVDAGLVVAVKPVEESLGLALRARHPAPLWVDIDDPDLEVRHFGKPLRDRMALAVRAPGYWARLHALRGRARRLPSTVSNPILGRRYGGTVLPHVRPSSPPRRHVRHAGLDVAFIGTPRPHKGLGDLRRAVARLAGRGVTLTVSAPEPPDARPWERWIGPTGLPDLTRLLRQADVVAVPTRPESWGSAQLPAKLVDAMMAGVAVVATDAGPNRWALGGTGLLVPPGDCDALTAALDRCRAAELRTRLGAAANARARRVFSVEAVAPAFAAFAGSLR